MSIQSEAEAREDEYYQHRHDMVELKQIRNELSSICQSIAPVLDWFQSDEQPERPLVEVVKEIVEQLQEDRRDCLKMFGAIKRFSDARKNFNEKVPESQFRPPIAN